VNAKRSNEKVLSLNVKHTVPTDIDIQVKAQGRAREKEGKGIDRTTPWVL
jgi:hypothetical protein